MSSSLIEIRLIYDDTASQHWDSLAIHAYMPAFLSGPDGEENIRKRVQNTYFRYDKALKRVCCCPKGAHESVFWVEREES